MSSHKLNYEKLLETIYQAALGESDWEHSIKSINRIFDSTAGGFFIQDDERGHADTLLMLGFAEGAMDDYSANYAENNPWFAIPGMMDPNCIRTEEDIDFYYKDKKIFRSTEMFNDWMLPQDFKHAIGGSITTRGPLHLNFTMFRPATTGAYVKSDIQALINIAPHLKRSLEVSSLVNEVRKKDKLLLAGMDSIGLGVIVLNEFQKITELNHVAESILNSNDGLSVVNQKIVVDHKEAKKLADAMYSQNIRSSLAPRTVASEWLYIPRPSQKPDYQIMLIKTDNPVNALFECGVTSMLFVVDPTRKRQLPKNRIQSRYSYTDREADVAEYLLGGKSAKDISKELEMTYESARWYIKQVCQKAGVRKQTEFIAKVLSEFSLVV